MTWTAFVAAIKQMAFPDREASNLVVNHSRYILDGLIELQKRIPELRSRNFNSIAFGDTFYQCKATVIDPKPNGPLIRFYTYTQPDHCDRVYYHPTTREHMESLMRTCGVNGDPEGSLVGPPPQDYYRALGDIGGTTLAANGKSDVVEPTIVRIEFSPSALIGGSSSVGTLTLLEPAGVEGVPVSVSSANPEVVKVPAIVTIPFGSRTATFPITTEQVEPSQNVIISAALGTRTVGLELQVHDPNIATDKGRRTSGYYAVIGAQVFAWPHIESNEHVVIEWSGIKNSYQSNDDVEFDNDVMAVIELYVQAQSALREECDMNRYAALQTSWITRSAELAWWYRSKNLLPESPWREPDNCPCPTVMATTTGGGGGTPPTTTTFTVYLGNAGTTLPPPLVFEPAFIKALDNSLGNSVTKNILTGEYNIGNPASDDPEWRVFSFPASVTSSPIRFFNSGFGMNFDELAQTIIDGVSFRVFRSRTLSGGTLSAANGNPLVVTT